MNDPTKPLPRSPKPRKKIASISIAIVLVFLAAGTLFVIKHKTAGSARSQQTVPDHAVSSQDVDSLRYPKGAPQLAYIQTQKVELSTLPLSDVLSARLVYDEDTTARIGVSIAGRIVAIRAAQGQQVKAGQVLAEIDSPDFGTASADLTKARADQKHKQLAVERAKELVPGDAIPVKDFESLQADLELARAETARAEQRVKNLNPEGLPVRGQRFSLVSPVSGVVTERTATPGLEVSAALPTPLFVITDPKRLWLLIDLPEQLMEHVKEGGRVEVESDAYPGKRFTAKIAQLGLLVDPNTRRVTVRAQVDNPDRKLLPEMFVRARLLRTGGAGIRLPNSAVVNDGVHAYVFVQTSPGEFHRRKVSVLVQSGDASYVGDGVRDGEQVVTTGALLLNSELEARSTAGVGVKP